MNELLKIEIFRDGNQSASQFINCHSNNSLGEEKKWDIELMFEC